MNDDNDNHNNNNDNNNEFAFQLVMSQVRVGQVLSLQSSLSCASLSEWPQWEPTCMIPQLQQTLLRTGGADHVGVLTKILSACRGLQGSAPQK